MERGQRPHAPASQTRASPRCREPGEFAGQNLSAPPISGVSLREHAGGRGAAMLAASAHSTCVSIICCQHLLTGTRGRHIPIALQPGPRLATSVRGFWAISLFGYSKQSAASTPRGSEQDSCGIGRCSRRRRCHRCGPTSPWLTRICDVHNRKSTISAVAWDDVRFRACEVPEESSRTAHWQPGRDAGLAAWHSCCTPLRSAGRGRATPQPDR